MWKLNKSIAKESLPTHPVDFAIEPWWGVCLVNFTLEEFKVRYLIKFSIAELTSNIGALLQSSIQYPCVMCHLKRSDLDLVLCLL